MFAIVEINGKQYSLRQGDIVIVDRLDVPVGNTVKLDRVLLVSNGAKTTVGTPLVAGALVKAKVASHDKGAKIQVRRFKSKVRERRARGFRPHHTKLEVVSIGA